MALKEKSGQLEDKEILELLERDIETNQEIPTRRDLNTENWSTTSYMVEERFGGINNALWRLGKSPNRETKVLEGDTEILEHTVRGIEHEKSRAPLKSEINKASVGNTDKYDTETPYKSLAKKFEGYISPEREDELVETLFIELEDPVKLVRNGEAHMYEIDLVSEAYLPWIDETYEPEQETGYSLNSEEELPETVFQMVADDYSQEEIKKELEIYDYHIRPVLNEMKQRDLIDTGGSLGTFLTDRGEKLYQSGDYREFFETEEFTTYQDL